ncbi:sulfite exporter TauE/SafE family protein [Gottfriedia acidiceleris]|uniref:urease accessory protein UreH domain-containing protein n=1 Tax=Gottfriedia acidiceleris TaxID=371036 RepID=UPI00101BD41F|nr:sulfite exporter TauE/SafE family protein [Gottfriedia acidiceleris]
MFNWSYQLVEYFMNVFRATQSIPIIASFVLGIVATLAPCQISGNLSALALFSSKSLQRKTSWKEVLGFIGGKIVAFSLLGLIVWIFGREISQSFTSFFPYFRKMTSPLIIFTGLIMIGYFKFGKVINFFPKKLKNLKLNSMNSFIMGFFLSLGFCPTMFSIFFFSLIPMALSLKYGFILPVLFSLGTSIPIIIFIYFLDSFGLSGLLLKKSRKTGQAIQLIFGVLLILLGVFDFSIFWIG